VPWLAAGNCPFEHIVSPRDRAIGVNQQRDGINAVFLGSGGLFFRAVEGNTDKSDI
jgi:hypothetical protein